MSRRELFRGGLAATLGICRPAAFSFSSTTVAPRYARLGNDVYSSLGVRPIINCDHVKSVLGGSLPLPEVIDAMENASHHFVQLDELMEAVGARLARLTRSEGCIVTSGCAASIVHATSACIAGGDPEKLRRLPNLDGLKNEVIIPRYSRNLYDQAVRVLGVKVIEVATVEELTAALNFRTCMIYVLGINDRGVGWLGDKIPTQYTGLDVKTIATIAQPKQVPIFVDAAAEDLSVPNKYLERGATLVGYSGGKVLRGPQCSGLLLGRKDLVRAAWIHSSPHHSFGRPMKVGKEEILGLLAAVDMWFKRDHAAEWRRWEAWLDYIDRRVSHVSGVTTEIIRAGDPTLNCPKLVVTWQALPRITGEEVKRVLEQGTPRVFVGESTGDWQESMTNSVTIRPLTLQSGEEQLVADRLHDVLSGAPKSAAPTRPAATTNVAGEWNVYVEYVAGNAEHTFILQQQGSELSGTHNGEHLTGELHGRIEGTVVRIQSAQRCEGNWLRYFFAGTVQGNKMSGTVDLGQYGKAMWTAEKSKV